MAENPRVHFSWEAFEFVDQKRGRDWFWALGIIALSSASAAIIVGNLLFAVLIIIGAIVIGLIASQTPEKSLFEINNRGIRVNSKLFPFQTLKSFWVYDEPEQEPVLIIESEKVLMPLICIPLEGPNPEDVRECLLSRLDEEEHQPPLSEKILQFFGF